MYHLVYLTRNLINNKIYVGVHFTWIEEDGYLGSGDALRYAIKKYGKENFKRVILHYCLTEEQSLEYESYIVDQSFIDRKDTYNIKLGGGNKVNHTDNIKAKISAKAKGRKHTIEQNKRQSERMIINNPFKNKHHKEETKKILSQKSKEQWDKKSFKEKQLMIDKASAKNTGQRRSKEFCEARSYHRKLQFPPKAKKFVITNPNNKIFIVHGTLKEFVQRYNLSQSLFQRYKNKGKIVGKQHKQSEQVKNSIGWEIKDYFL